MSSSAATGRYRFMASFERLREAGPHIVSKAPETDGMTIDYDRILQANLARVFGEREPARRLEAIRELYAADAILYEPDRIVQGHDAISQAVGELLATLPPQFTFTAIRAALGHHGVGRLQWRAGPAGGPAVMTGIDVAQIEEGVIRSLHVFLDQATA